MLHGDMTMYSHATILGVLLGQISHLFIAIKLCLHVSCLLILHERLNILPPYSILIGI